MKPVYKIEVWEPGGGSALHSITKDANNVIFREVITDGVGFFCFDLPTKKGSSYKYNDIDLNDTVKIWLGYDTVPMSPTWIFIGKIGKISGPLSAQTGYIRQISGLSQGEILRRRFKKNKYYNATGASTIVSEWATDLSLGTGDIETDATAVTMEVKTKSYFDLLREISDYWVSAGSQIKKDFYVNVDNDLIWRSRPLRAAGSGTADSGSTTTTVDSERTEVDDYWNGTYIKFTSGDNIGFIRSVTDFDAGTDTLTHDAFPYAVSVGDTYTLSLETLVLGDNLLAYNITQKIDEVKNDIVVYGAAEKPRPADKDSWTESLTDWNVTTGYLYLESTTKKLGSYSIRCQTDDIGHAPYTADFDYTLSSLVNIRDINTLCFWRYLTLTADVYYVYLYAPDSSNSFRASINNTSGWVFKELSLGPNYEYDANENPNGIWTKTGSPIWWNIQKILFHIEYPGASQQNVYVDVLYFYPERWTGTASDATSKTNYGQRDLEITDDKLHTDSDCTKRAETLLYQKKDPPTQIEVTTEGNTNILVGDRLPMTIPAEDISAVNYDVFSVEQVFSNGNFITKATMVNSVNIRQTIETDPIKVLANMRRTVRGLSMDEKAF